MFRTPYRPFSLLAGASLLPAFGAYGPEALANNATGTVPTTQVTATRDGSHDFDFLFGKWKMPNHRLLKRLANAHEWEDFMSYDECGPLPGGIGNQDIFRTE